MPDRAQDTEAIRAARKWDGTSHDPISTEQAHEVAANWRDTTQLANALDAMADEADRLVARLEAAQTELGLAVSYIPASRIAAYRMRRAALAAAAPGETTPADASATVECPRCGNETTEADMTYSGCGLCRAEAAADDLVDAAPGETERTP